MSKKGLDEFANLPLKGLVSQEAVVTEGHKETLDDAFSVKRECGSSGFLCVEKKKEALIGATAFKKIRYSETFIDKTLFIKALIEAAGSSIGKEAVTFITRPSQMGKTAIVEMVRAFFSKEIDGEETRPLFEGLNIFHSNEYREMQGTYPTIFITFKDVDGNNFEEVFHQIQEQIKNTYREHLCHRNNLLKEEFRGYERIVRTFIDGGMDYTIRSKVVIMAALRDLTEYLYKAYGKEVVVLVDAYDTPLLRGIEHHFLEEVAPFIEGIFKPLFKDNGYLYKGLITGIFRISKASIFSSLNNMSHFSVLSREYAPFFGFTEEEVQKLLGRAGRASRMKYLKLRYGCYRIGGIELYNPWSIINDLRGVVDQSSLSNNSLIKKLVGQYGRELTGYFSRLLLKKDVPCNSILNYSEYQFLSQIRLDGSVGEEDAHIGRNLLSFFLHYGYLTRSRSQGLQRGDPTRYFCLTNFEILKFFSEKERMQCFQLSETTTEEIENLLPQLEEEINLSDDRHIYNAPQSLNPFFDGSIVSQIEGSFNKTKGSAIVFYGAVASGRRQVIDHYIWKNKNNYSYIFVLKHFCSGFFEREYEFGHILGCFFNIEESPGEKESKNRKDSFLKKLYDLDGWLVVIEFSAVRVDSNAIAVVAEFLKAQEGSPRKHLIIKDRNAKRTYGYDGAINYIENSFPTPEKSIEFIRQCLGISIESIDSPGREELIKLLHGVAYYANYCPSRMRYFSDQILKRSEKKLLHKVKCFIEKVRKQTIDEEESADYYINFFSFLEKKSMIRTGFFQESSKEEGVLEIVRLLGFSKKMISMYFVFLQKTFLLWGGKNFSEELAILSSYIQGVKNKKIIFHRFLMYLLDFVDGIGDSGSIRRRVMALSLFYSNSMSGECVRSFLRFPPQEVSVDDLLGFRFLFGSSGQLASLSMDHEVWSSIQKATLSLYLDEGKMLGWDADKARIERQSISDTIFQISKCMALPKMGFFENVILPPGFVCKKSTEEREQVESDVGQRYKSDSDADNRAAVLLDLKLLKTIEENDRDPEAIFRYLAVNKYSWSMILKGSLYNKSPNREDVVIFLRGVRSKIDENILIQAVEKIFNERGLKCTDQKYFYDLINRDVKSLRKKEYEDKFRAYSIEVSLKVGEGKASQCLFRLNVMAEESKDLSSDVSLTVEVEIPSLNNEKDLDARRFKVFKKSIEEVQVSLCDGFPKDKEDLVISNLDARMALQAIVVHYFNEFGVQAVGMTSVMSRGTNIYAKDFSSDPNFLKFTQGLRVFPDGKEFLSSQEFTEAKVEKQRLRMAASLLSMREYYDGDKKSWETFCVSITYNSPRNSWPASFKLWLDNVIKLVEKWHSDRKEEIKQKEDQKKFIFDASSNSDSNSFSANGGKKNTPEFEMVFEIEEDRSNYLRGELYALSLLRLAKSVKEFLDSCAENRRQEMISILKKLEDIEGEIRISEKEIQRHVDEKSTEATTIRKLRKQLMTEKSDREKILVSLNNKKEEHLDKLRGEASLKLKLHEKEVEARFRALGARPSPDARYHMNHRFQSQGDGLKIDRCQVVMGAICQQVSLYLLHLKAYRDSKLPEGEVLYRLAEHGQYIADMLYGGLNSWFENKVSFWHHSNSQEDNAILKRLFKGRKGVVDIPDRRVLDFILNRDVKLVTKIKENKEIEYSEKANAAYNLALLEYYKFMHSEKVSKEAIAIKETTDKEFREFRFEREPQVLINLMQNVIRITLEVKLGHAECEQKNSDEVVVWGQTFKLSQPPS